MPKGRRPNLTICAQEWGPSSFGDVRHRMVVGTSLPLPGKISVSPFIMASSGAPYNITTGRDTNGDSITTERPSLVSARRQGSARDAICTTRRASAASI